MSLQLLNDLNPAPAGSHLAGNKMLMDLGAAYGAGPFTSLAVSRRLSLDFLYAAKMLHRLRKRYLLRVVGRTPRICGGYENHYSIAPKGWSKIDYLRRPSVQTGSFGSRLLRTRYLFTGHGSAGELLGMRFFKKVWDQLEFVEPVTDRLGSLLVGLDPRFLSLDLGMSILPELFPTDTERTMLRAAGLQHLGLVPKDICPPVYGHIAKSLGSRDFETLVTLLLRGEIELQRKNNDLQEKLNGVCSELRDVRGELRAKATVETEWSDSWSSKLNELQVMRRVRSQVKSLIDCQFTCHKVIWNYLSDIENAIRTVEIATTPSSPICSLDQAQRTIAALALALTLLMTTTKNAQSSLDEGTQLCIQAACKIENAAT